MSNSSSINEDNDGYCKNCEKLAAEIERLRSELDSFQRRFVAVDDVLKAKSREIEIERLRASERSAWNAAVERDEKIEKLKAENQVLAETITVIETLPEIVKEEKDEEIERLRGLLREGLGEHVRLHVHPHFPAWEKRVREALEE